MKWLKKYELGYDKIDLEHRVFFDLVQSMSHADAQGESKDKIRRLIAEVAKYAEFHFLSEENIMIDVGYPDFEAHHAHHEHLLTTLQGHIIDFESGSENVSSLVAFLNEWFIRHTTNEDLRLTKYLSKSS